MSLYNLICGYSPATFLILPMLGEHPDEYPRFRDCFTSDKDYPEYDDYIHVYTRIGGGNREDYESGIEELQAHPNYVDDFDDSFDSTYATFVFSVPDKWKKDYEAIKSRNLADVSQEYKDQLMSIYPSLSEKISQLFC